MSADRDPVVLVVDNNREHVNRYVRWLEPEHNVRRAHSVLEARAMLGDEPDVAFLRQTLAEELIQEFRDRRIPCRTAILAEIEPTRDARAKGFDLCLTDPIGRAELLDAAARLSRLRILDRELQGTFGTAAERSAALDDGSAAPKGLSELQSELADAGDELSAILAELEEEDVDALFHDLDRPRMDSYR